MDEFLNNPVIGEFLKLIDINVLVESAADSGYFVVKGEFTDPPIVAGVMEGSAGVVYRISFNGIVYELYKQHGYQIFMNIELFMYALDAYLDNDKLEENVEKWESRMQRNENVHDNSVNIAFKRSYAAIKKENAATPHKFFIANIKSYFYNRARIISMELSNMKNVVAGATKLDAYCNTIDLTNYPALCEKEPEMKHVLIELEKIRDILTMGVAKLFDIEIEMRELQVVITVLNHIEKENEYVATVDDNEVNVLLEVWKRIHDSKNDESRDKILNLFRSELATLKTLVDERPNEIECVNGRIGAMLGSLEVYDADNIVNIKSVPALRVMIVQNNAPVIINNFLSAYDSAIVAKYNDNIIDDDTTKLRDTLIAHIRETITRDYSNELSAAYIDKFINEIIANSVNDGLVTFLL